MKTSNGITALMPEVVRRWKRYPTYIDLGLPWKLEIPSHWRRERLKYVATVRPSNVDKKTVEGQEPVRLCNYVDVYKNDYITADLEFMPATATEGQIATFSLHQGDVIITKDSESWDDIAVPAFVRAELPGIVCGYHLALVRSDQTKLDGEYLFRCFSAEGICDQFRIAANGITRFGLGSEAINDSLFPMPPLDEQRRIAAFLDRETAKIDSLIAKKKSLIEMLQEKRTALISHAVTQALNSGCRTKEAAIAGLGMVPAHWQEICVKRVITYITSGSRGWAEFYTDEGDLFIQSGNLNLRLGLDLSTIQHVKPPEGAEVARTQVRRSDVLVCVTGAYTGNVALVDIDLPRAFVNQHVALVRPSFLKILPRFLAYLLSSTLGAWHFKISQYGGTKQGLGLDDIRLFRFYLPPLNEQEEILHRLDKTLTGLESLSSRIRKGIDTLLEYRTALISAAVTGKIDLREEVG